MDKLFGLPFQYQDCLDFNPSRRFNLMLYSNGIFAGNNSDYTFHGINQIAGFVTAAYSLVGSNNKLVSLV